MKQKAKARQFFIVFLFYFPQVIIPQWRWICF